MLYLENLKLSAFLCKGAIWWSEVSCWLAEDHRGGGSSSWWASKATDHWTCLHSKWSEWCTFLGLLQEVVRPTRTVLPALLCAQSVPAYFHECQWEEFNPPWAACIWKGGPPETLWHCTVPGGRGAGCLHGDRGWKGGRAAGEASSVCCRCQCASWGHHAPITQEPDRQ